jgi:methylated-DNA-[protein]-cysteine S-methyltransferase
MIKQHPAQELAFRFFASPLGWVLLAASPEGLRLVHFCGFEPPSRQTCEALLKKDFPSVSAIFASEHPLLQEAEQAITAYFQHRRPIPAFPLDMRAGTAFQRQVWEALELIPFGETRSYLEVARSIGKPQAPRAVGQACGRNPIPILVPCHRVVSANGGLGGFSGGLHLKKALLALEQAKESQGIKPKNRTLITDDYGG